MPDEMRSGWITGFLTSSSGKAHLRGSRDVPWQLFSALIGLECFVESAASGRLHVSSPVRKKMVDIRDEVDFSYPELGLIVSSSGLHSALEWSRTCRPSDISLFDVRCHPEGSWETSTRASLLIIVITIIIAARGGRRHRARIPRGKKEESKNRSLS